MFQDDQPFSLLISAAHTVGGCKDVLFLLRAKQDLTIAQGVDYLTNQTSPAWPYWTFKHLHHHLTPGSRRALLARLTRAPTLALRTYLDIADLTDSEDVLLYGAIEKNLPTAVQELIDGVIIRTKLSGGP